MTLPALVHNWRGLQEDQNAVTQPVDPPSVSDLCFVGPPNQVILTTGTAANNLVRSICCNSEDGLYAIINGNRGNNVARHGYYYSSDNGRTWTHQQWSGVTCLDSSGAANSSNPFSASGTHYVINLVWEPFYERFIIAYDTSSTTRFFWMDPAVSMTEWREFQETDAANIGIRSWIVIPNGDGSLFMGIVGAGSFNGRAKLFTTNGPTWNDQADVQVDSTSSFVRDIFSDQDGTGIDFNVMYYGVKVGGIYQLWVQGGDGGISTGNNLRWLRWDGSTTANVVAERDWFSGYAPAFTFGDNPSLSLSFKTGSLTLLPITSALMPTTASRDAAEYDLPSHPTLGGQLISTGWNENAGWVACGVPDSTETYPSPVGVDGFDKILVWTSTTGLEGSWNGPFVMDIPDQAYDANSSCSWIDDVALLRERSGILYLGGSGTPNKWGLVAPRAGAENEPIVHCFSATAGGAQIINDGVATYTENDLYWIGLGPDLYWPLDDDGTPASVIDFGTKQYVNTTNGADASDIAFGETGPFSGTACEFQNADAEITVRPTLTDHWIWAVADLDGVAENTEILAFDFQWPGGDIKFKIVNTEGGWLAAIEQPDKTISSSAISLQGGNAQILVRYKNRAARGEGSSIMEVYGPTSPEPIDTIEVDRERSVPFFDQCLMTAAGNSVTLDNVVIIPGENATAEELIDNFTVDEIAYDPAVGIDSVDITPGTPSLADTSQPEDTLVITAWHMQEDGTGLIFVDGRTFAMYRTTDYGDTWTGPFDYSSDLDISTGPNNTRIVGRLKYEDGLLYGVTSYLGVRRSQIIHSSDYGSTWNRQNVTTVQYGWAVQKLGSNFVYGGRVGGVGFRLYTTPITSGSPSDPTPTTRDTLSSGTNNLLGVRLDEDGNVLIRYQVNESSRYDPTNFSTLGDVDWSFGPGLSDMNTVLVNNIVFAPEVTIDSGTETADPIPTTDEDGLDVSGFENARCLSYNPTTGLQKFWTINSSVNERDLKVYAYRNKSQTNGGWGDRYHVNLPPGLSLRPSLPGHAKAAANYIFFCAPMRDASGSANRGYRLIRWESPYATGDIEYPDPGTPSAPGNVKCLVNAESPSGLDIGNEAPSAPANDVLASQASNVSTVDPKFGSRHLAIPYRSSRISSKPYTQPYWNGMAGLDIGNQDLTLEGWWKTTSAARFGYLGSSQNYRRQGGKYWRWGGMKMSLSGTTGGVGRMSFYIGLSLGDALARRTNDIYAGNAVATNLQWNSGFLPNDYNHVAACRIDGRWYFFLNGQLPDSVGLGAAADAYIYDSGLPWFFGMYLYPFDADTRLSSYSQPCRIDSFRFILGDGIYSQNFAVPEAAFS